MDKKGWWEGSTMGMNCNSGSHEGKKLYNKKLSERVINYNPYVGRNSIGKDDLNCIKCASWVSMFLTYDDIKVEKQYSRDMITESFIYGYGGVFILP